MCNYLFKNMGIIIIKIKFYFLEGKMILNTGSRTDIVQYFSDWLLKRFEEGVVYSRNPLYPCKVTRYELSPDKIDVVL